MKESEREILRLCLLIYRYRNEYWIIFACTHFFSFSLSFYSIFFLSLLFLLSLAHKLARHRIEGIPREQKTSPGTVPIYVITIAANATSSQRGRSESFLMVYLFYKLGLRCAALRKLLCMAHKSCRTVLLSTALHYTHKNGNPRDESLNVSKTRTALSTPHRCPTSINNWKLCLHAFPIIRVYFSFLQTIMYTIMYPGSRSSWGCEHRFVQFENIQLENRKILFSVWFVWKKSIGFSSLFCMF